jgi:hypothetical protein
MEQKRDFKGIWIPAEIWLLDIPVMEKLFLVEIDSLDNKDGCFASNKYFSDFFKISKGRCSQIIKSLEEKEFITITYVRKENSKEIETRIIKSNFKYTKVVNKLNTVVNKLNDPIKNIKPPYLENAKENNTIYNNIYDNTIEQQEKKDIEKQIEKLYLDFYPLKKGKAKGIQKALIAIKNNKITLNELETCIKNYAEEVKDRDKKYIKHFSTFMNGDYMDYLNVEKEEEEYTWVKTPDGKIIKIRR